MKLRKPKESDAPELYEVVDTNRDHLSHLTWVKSATLESTANFLDNIPESELLHIIEVDGRIAGIITLRVAGPGHKYIGYWLAKEHCGKGIMRDAVKAILEPLDDLTIVSAHVRQSNTASASVLMDCGFHREFVDFDGLEYWDEWIYSTRFN